MTLSGGSTIRFSMITPVIAETEQELEAMVIANEGENFSVGAKSGFGFSCAQAEEGDELNISRASLPTGDDGNQIRLEPVVVAPFARTWEGGCEVAPPRRPHSSFRRTLTGSGGGGVGVHPRWRGCKESILRLKDPEIMFETIVWPRSHERQEAPELAFPPPGRRISMNPRRLIADAKRPPWLLYLITTRPSADEHQVSGRPPVNP